MAKSKAAAELGRLGGKARARKLSKTARVESARKAGQASAAARRDAANERDESFDLGVISIAWLDLKAHEILSSANEAEFSRMLRVVVAEAVAKEQVEFREVAAQAERFRQRLVAAQQQTQLIAEERDAEIAAVWETCERIAKESSDTRFVDGDRIYCNGWRFSAECIAEKIRVMRASVALEAYLKAKESHT